MLRRIIPTQGVLFIILLATSLGCASETKQGTPEWIVESFFISKEFPNHVKYYTGEMLQHYVDVPNMGSRVSEGTKTYYRIISETKNRKNFAITYSNKNMCQNWYCYVVKKKGDWKLEAVRALALTGVLHSLLEQLEEKEVRTEEENWMLENLRLRLACDEELKEYLKANLEKFTEIVKTFSEDPNLLRVQGLEKSVERTGPQLASNKPIASTVHELHLNFVNQASKGVIELNIGGVVDNSVGFLFITDEDKVPQMSPGPYIYVEKITGSWYIYKTT